MIYMSTVVQRQHLQGPPVTHEGRAPLVLPLRHSLRQLLHSLRQLRAQLCCLQGALQIPVCIPALHHETLTLVPFSSMPGCASAVLGLREGLLVTP